MRFPCTCLPISKYGSIIALQYTLDNGKRCMVKYIFLRACGIKCHVEAEHSLLLTDFFGIGDNHFTSFWINIHDSLIASFDFIARHRPASYGHFDTLIFVTHLNFGN